MDEYQQRELFREVTDLTYIRKFIKDVLNDIKKREPVFDGWGNPMQYGFGKGTYYETKRELIKDAIEQLFQDEWEQLFNIPQILNAVLETIKDVTTYTITNQQDVIDHLDGTLVILRVKLEGCMDNFEKEVLKQLTTIPDDEINSYIRQIEGAE